MKIQLTGVTADLLKTDSLEIESGSTVGEIKQILTEKYPDLKKYIIQLAVNSSYASNEQVIESSDQVMVFSPYSGG